MGDPEPEPVSRPRGGTSQPERGFARSVLTLVSGTALAQLLLVLAVPVLARLYTPADYGVLAVYSATLSVLVVLGSLRYEAAITLPEDDETASALLALCILILIVMAGAVSLLLWFAGDRFVTLLNVPGLRPYLWLIPFGLTGAGLYQALSHWTIRRGAFTRLARTKLSQGIGQVVAQVGLGAAGVGAPGLLIGDLVGRVAGAGGLGVTALRDRPAGSLTLARLRAAASRYRRFPLLTTWAGLLNQGSLQLPSMFFSAAFGVAAAGLYALSYKMMVLPTMLVASAVGQVFLSRAAVAAREPEQLAKLTERTAVALFAAGLPAFGLIALAGPQLFAAVMGSRWEQSGQYAQILAPWFALWLVSNPLSGLLSVREWQGSALAFTTLEFTLRLGALLIGESHNSPRLAVALLSASGVVIASASIVRFMLAGYSSAGRLLGPAARLLGLAAGCLLPGAAALYAGSRFLAMVTAALGTVVYYVLVSRSVVPLHGIRFGMDPSDTEATP
jgi:O-antigen/teichoic acid export membrane protein